MITEKATICMTWMKVASLLQMTVMWSSDAFRKNVMVKNTECDVPLELQSALLEQKGVGLLSSDVVQVED
eukprot:8933922-Ditylum_brightwellii.AAC.1